MLKTITNLLPDQTKRIMSDRLRDISERFWKDREKSLPTDTDLQSQHLTHVKLLPNRVDMLKCLPKEAIVAEVGVNRGEFSEQILDRNQPQKLHLIDLWGDKRRYHDGLKHEVSQKFAQQLTAGRVEIHVGYSTQVVEQFEDNYFDWVYIDTDHTYATTKAELLAYSKKVKPNGIIAGHDYITGQWNRMVRYGVVEAVNEFCLTHNWEMLYLTVERSDHPSFAIRKIQE